MMERKQRWPFAIPSKKGVGFGKITTLILAQLCTGEHDGQNKGKGESGTSTLVLKGTKR